MSNCELMSRAACAQGTIRSDRWSRVGSGKRLQPLCRCNLTQMLQCVMLMLTTAERWCQHWHSKLTHSAHNMYNPVHNPLTLTWYLVLVDLHR